MYKLIGADQREYGPVSLEQVQQWIAEGRANGATLAQAEGQTEWTPLSSYPEFAEALSRQSPLSLPSAAPTLPSDPDALATAIRTRGYDIDIGSCVSRSWALTKNHLGLFIGATLIFLILSAGVGQLISYFTRPTMISIFRGNVSAGPILFVVLLNVPNLAFSTLLTAGFYLMLLKAIRGQNPGIGDLFAGFGGPILQLAIGGIVIQLLTVIGALFCLLPGIYLSIAWVMAVPLMIDRRFDFWTAMEVSRKVTSLHWWLMFCLLLVAALVNLVGFIACCVGLLVAFPVALGAIMFAYDDIFGRPAPL